MRADLMAAQFALAHRNHESQSSLRTERRTPSAASRTFGQFAITLCLVGLICVTYPSFGVADDDQSLDSDEAARLFTLKVLPLLKEKCQGCHGEDASDIKGEFSVLDREALLRGGESEEPAIVPGDSAGGTLMEAVTWEGLEMPPKENDRLTDEQIEVMRKWIEHGAPWPAEDQQKRFWEEEAAKEVTSGGVRMMTSGGTSDEWSMRRYEPSEMWAFQAVNQMSQERVAQLLAERETNASADSDAHVTALIDALIEERASAAGLDLANQADPRDLVRRAYFDLTGLPPTPEAVADFEEAYDQDADDAWKSLVDQLLASPRYGEHWGRHWLDVTRYADTGGMSNDYERSNMWRYRDYVIRAFNEDKPYSEFIVEQLAGDELADRSVRERTQGDDQLVYDTQLKGDYTQQEAEWLVATGFLRLGPWDNAMVEEPEARQMYLDDVVNITGQTFLSQTLRCCKCHDHKFDPIPTRDYYSIYAAFSTTHMAERPVPLLEQESQEGFEEGQKHVQQMLEFAVTEKNKLVNKRETAAKKWFEEHGLPYKDDKARKDLPDDEKPPRHVGLDYVDEGTLKVREQDEWIWNRRLERYKPMAQSVYNSAAAKLAWNGARKLRIDRKSNAKDPLVNHILLGGALTALGDQVTPGVLSVVSLNAMGKTADQIRLPTATDGRRLQLAQWIADPSNPLTTRSIVNRIWQYHFGRGIAANSNNFGAKGARPSHPELLDLLASELVEGGWHIKRLHRIIMHSAAYRRSTVAAAPTANGSFVAEVDPDNQLLTYFPRRRLSAEELRDAVLSITGELVQCDGGLPVSPEINMEVALQPRMIQFSLAPAYQPSARPELRNRRSVYAYQVRGQADPFTELFNQPNPNESCELRESASVTPQVFTLLNSDMMTDRSIALALRLESESNETKGQIARAFELVLGREATAEELQRGKQYVGDMLAYHQQQKPSPIDYPTEITRSVVEEFSGKSFDYQEILPVFANYQADPKASDVSAETRALADFCLLLLNTNEFMYVE